jgi:hypothetical protein
MGRLPPRHSYLFIGISRYVTLAPQKVDRGNDNLPGFAVALAKLTDRTKRYASGIGLDIPPDRVRKLFHGR